MTKKIKKLSFIDPSGANLKEVKIFIDKVIKPQMLKNFHHYQKKI